IANQTEPVYGVTTGFGSLCKVSVSKDELSQLQVNLIKSHACGVGPRVENDIVRIMLLLKIQSLSYGYSGCKLDTVERLIDFFNHDITPVVYRQGSLGASGDLVPLAHLCLPLVGEGEVEMQGEVISGAEMLEKMGWKPIEMASKEGLALLNGTQNMSAYAVWSLLEAQRLSDWADVIAAMSLDAFDGRIEPFTHAVHAVRPHLGQIETARRFRELLDGSELIRGQKVHVQDPYSFRCVPQVHGAVKDTLRYVKSVIDIEINSATDNPIVRPDEDLIISAGNFHGEPIALPIDFLSIAMSELANISERRIYRLVSGLRGLPDFLVANPGLNSGFMITQYTAASCVSLNKSLAMPSSVDSIPSCQDQEDLVSMGANAAIKLQRVIQNTERVLAIELFNAAQALDFRLPKKSSPTIMAVRDAFRERVPFISDDVVMYPLIENAIQFLREYEN
ncbi:MAG: histidine ammonia-lyase, partial [Prevotella sp.]|nr:histidine ammonia-lyase [Prevotella sp.]